MGEEKTISKKAWLDHLYYDEGKQNYDFKVCGLKKAGDGVISTKWKRYSEACFDVDIGEEWKIDWINNRVIFPNEIVLDIEEKEKLPKALEKLDKIEIKYYLYETGSRGYHIHIWCDSLVSEDTKEFFAKSFGADILKCGSRTMIALEHCPHWKTGRIKKLIKWK